MSIDLDGPYPRVAVTPEELTRLRKAWKGEGPEHEVVAQRVQRAIRHLADPLRFPPRGGQHNTWYQCQACQRALVTVDPTHHQCPLCKKVYSGPPYDDVVFSRQHSEYLGGVGREVRLSDAAWAYAVTGDERFARDAAAILLGYAERYRKYPLHSNDLKEGSNSHASGGHIYEQTLTEAAAMVKSIAPAYDLIHDSSALADSDRQAIRDGLIRPMLETIAKYCRGKSNWQTWHNAAMVWGGAVLGEESWVHRGIDDPAHGFRFQIAACISPEGMWYENSWAYHFYALDALVETAEAGRRLGIDLWNQAPLKAMCSLPIHYVMGDGTLPRFGDAVNTRLTESRTRELLETASQAFPDADLAGWLPEKPDWATVLTGRKSRPGRAAPAMDSAVYPGTGHAILRTDGAARLTAALTFGPYGGGHGHFDKLSFVFFGYGRELAVDPGRAASQAYGLPIHNGWYRATASHNAVVVDDATQSPASGELELFAHQPSYAAVAARCTQAYQGVSQRRLLVLAPEYLVAVDDLSAEDSHRFTWLYHNRGKRVVSTLPMEQGEANPLLPGVPYLHDIRRAVTDGPLAVEFADEDLTTHVLLAGGTNTGVALATGPCESVEVRVPLVALDRSGKRVCFAAVIEPVSVGGRESVEHLTLERSGDTITIRISKRQGVDIVAWSPGRLKVSADDRPVLP